MNRACFYPLLLSAAFAAAGCSGGNKNVVEASGTIEGTDVNIGTEVAGRVTTLRVDEGSRVTNGDTLLTIDDTEYQIQLRQALANLESYDASYRLALAGYREEDVIQAEVAFKNAQEDYKRMKDLLASQTVTQKQYDDTYTRYVAAQQTYEKMRRGLRPEEIASAHSRREYAAAQVDLLRKKVRDCSVVSPTNGTVTLKAIEPGELVTLGSNVLRITRLDPVDLMIYVNEQDLGRIRLGQSANVSIDTFGEGRSFEGTVVYISPVAEFTPKNVQTKEERTKLVFGVKLEVKNPDGALKPGLPADARISTAAGS
jgi:HlyD family secretion protein